MEKTMIKFSLDLQESFSQKVVKVKKGDTARTLVISLRSGGRVYALAPDAFCVLTAKKADGTALYNSCEIRENQIFYDFTAETASCPGRMPAELRIFGGDRQLLTSAYFTLEVQDTVFTAQDAAKSKDEQTALEALTDKTVTAANAANTLVSQVEKKLQDHAFDGESAYEIAVRLGYQGTEEQWIQSLQYDHSQEFQSLAAQVRQNAESARQDAEQTAAGAKGASRDAAQAKAQAQAAEKSRKAIEDLSVVAETLPDTSIATVKKTLTPEGSVRLQLGIPRGRPGENGKDGVRIQDRSPSETTVFSSAHGDQRYLNGFTVTGKTPQFSAAVGSFLDLELTYDLQAPVDHDTLMTTVRNGTQEQIWEWPINFGCQVSKGSFHLKTGLLKTVLPQTLEKHLEPYSPQAQSGTMEFLSRAGALITVRGLQKSQVSDGAPQCGWPWSSLKSTTAFSPALRRTVTGEAVTADDVSPLEHRLFCRVSSKNLVPGLLPGTYGDQDGIYSPAFANVYCTRKFPYPGRKMFLKNSIGNQAISIYCWNAAGDFLGKYAWNQQHRLPQQTDQVALNSWNSSDQEVQWIYASTVDDVYTPYIEDFSQVTLSLFGKNLWESGASFDVTGDSGFHDLGKIEFSNPVSAVHVSCAYEKLDPTGSSEGSLLLLTVLFTDGVQKYFTVVSTGDPAAGRADFPVSAPGCKIRSIRLGTSSRFTGGRILLKDFMVSLQQTAYSPFTPPEHFHPEKDGSLSAMHSPADGLTVLTDTPGAILELTYNQDPNLVSKTPEIPMTSVFAVLEPNRFYTWGEVNSLTISLAPAVPGIANEYMFQFQSPSEAATNLNLPGDIKWAQPLVIEGGKTYQVSILNGLGVYAGV